MNKMPLGIARLTSLQTLPKVIIEVANGFKISDLKDLSDLEGRLSIIGLDKVIDPIHAEYANLHQKTGLDVLKMEWSDVLDDSQNEMIQFEVLKELRPHHKLKNLKILFYKGIRFPSWVGDPSFDHLTKLKLCGSRSTHLPALGHLRSLKKLSVRRMNEVKTVGFELLAPTNVFSGIAFPSLEVLKFDDMQGWQRWSINIDDDHGTPRSFPRLHTICIRCCPELDEVSIGFIPSLRVVDIKECSKAVVRSMVGLSSSIVRLKISNVKGLTQLHREDLMHLRAVENLYFEDCDELRYLWERESEACKSLVSLQKLEVSKCKKLVSSAEKLEVDFGISMESLKEVLFTVCETLESYNCPNTVERLVIGGCGSLTSLTFSTVQEQDLLPMSRLTSLRISYCNNLKSFPPELFQRLTSLEILKIEDCPGMDYSFPCGLWPPNLSKLSIGGLNKPMSEWGLQNFPTSLVHLLLSGKNSGAVSFAVADGVSNSTPSSTFLLPPSLVYLGLSGFKDLESLSEVLKHLSCLERLDIWHCPKLGDLKPTSSSSNLTIKVWC